MKQNVDAVVCSEEEKEHSTAQHRSKHLGDRMSGLTRDGALKPVLREVNFSGANMNQRKQLSWFSQQRAELAPIINTKYVVDVQSALCVFDDYAYIHRYKHTYRDGDGAGTGTEVEVNKGSQYGNEDGSGDGAGTGSGTGVETRGLTQDGNGDGSGDGNESSSGDGDGDEDENRGRNENGIGESGREANKRKKPHKSCRRHMRNGGDLGGKRKKRRQERVGSVAANPDNLDNIKEAEGEAQGTQSLGENCASRGSVSPLSRLIRGFRNKHF